MDDRVPTCLVTELPSDSGNNPRWQNGGEVPSTVCRSPGSWEAGPCSAVFYSTKFTDQDFLISGLLNELAG